MVKILREKRMIKEFVVPKLRRKETKAWNKDKHEHINNFIDPLPRPLYSEEELEDF